MRRIRRAVVVAAAVAVVLFAAQALAAKHPPGPTYIAPNGANDDGEAYLFHKPRSMPFVGPTYSGRTRGVRWAGWGHRRATGHGRVTVCYEQPRACVRRVPVTITAYRRRFLTCTDRPGYLYRRSEIYGRLDPKRPKRVISLLLSASTPCE